MANPFLIAVGGLLASGKSTVSRAVAAELDALHIEADELRATFDRAGRRDALAPGFSETVYDEMFARADAALAAGRAVVLDGTFRSRERRARARELARRHGAIFRFVECRVPEERVRERLTRRDDAKGWLAMLDHFLPLWEPADEIDEGERVVLDTSGPLEHAPDRDVLGLQPS